MTVAEKQTQLTEDFAIIEDRQERLSAVVDHARRRPPLPADEKTDAHRVPGCVSSVWLLADLTDGRLHLRYDADSPLVKGLVGLLVELYDDAPLPEIVATEPTILADLGLLQDLTPTRQNGLAAVRARIKSLAQ
ncbi:MAG TPA: SufE family protein [Rariglobus sp.]|nr:SufE family protein [Rariglobus sp.]